MNQEIKVCGDNNSLLLNDNSNNISVFGSQVVSPPLTSQIDPSTLLSYSIYSDHMVIITNNGEAYGIGDNRDFRISTSLPKEKIYELTKFPIKDDTNNTLYTPISAVCGCKYTLYLVKDPNDSNSTHLIYTSKETQKMALVQIGRRIPVSLFGGRNDCGAIDSEGSIIFISNLECKVFNSTLPSSEKVSTVACCDKYVFVLSKSGRLFQSFSGDELEFSEVSELRNEKIVGLSGSWFHCLAISKGGKVFGYGENYCGQLGLGKEICEVDKFREIELLQKYNVSCVYAGGTHSLFQTKNGGVIACGCNFYGQLLIESGPSKEKIFKPCETTIQGGASFCIAGDGISIIFINNVPKNNPNIICSI